MEITTDGSATAAAPAVHVPVAAWLAAAVATAAVALLVQDGGAVLAQSWEGLHELFHDGRHLFGAACH